MKKATLILCLLFSICFCAEILSLSGREKKAMKNDFAVLDNAYRNGYSNNLIEFAERFLERYKLASVSQETKIRNMYLAVENLIEYTRNDNISQKDIEQVSVIIEDKELERLFSAVLLGTAEDILAFSEKYPIFREKDIYGALERARVNDLSLILTSINKNSIPVNEIVRFSQIYGDSISIENIKTAAEKMVYRYPSLLKDYRMVFGITEFDGNVEQYLYRKIMYDTDYRNLISYIENFPEGKYIRFVSELVGNYR